MIFLISLKSEEVGPLPSIRTGSKEGMHWADFWVAQPLGMADVVMAARP